MLSIIIVSWNAKKFLLECLGSIGAQNIEGLEIIVVDNASSDGSPQAVKELFPQVKVIPCPVNHGFAKANNIGIKESSGKYVCLINSDVLVLDGCLEKMLSYMEIHPQAGLAGPMVLNGDMTLQRSCRKFPTLTNTLLTALGFESVLKDLIFFPHDREREVEVISGCFLLARRKAVDKVGLLDERFFFYSEDKDWCKRFYNAGWKAVFLPEARAIHFGGSSSANAPVRFYIEMQKANLQYWRKHHGMISQGVLRTFILIHQIIRILRGALLYALKPNGRTDTAHKIKRSVECLKWLFGLKMKQA